MFHAKPTMDWEISAANAAIARTKGYILVVRPSRIGKLYFRFVVMKVLSDGRRISHVCFGYRATPWKALLAAERTLLGILRAAEDEPASLASQATFRSTRAGGQVLKARVTFRPAALRQLRRAA